MDAWCRGGVRVAEEGSAGGRGGGFPVDVGGREYAEGARRCGGSRVHEVRVGAVAFVVVRGCVPRLVGRVGGRGEEGLEHRPEA